MELFNKFLMYMDYPFVRYALVTGVLIALASSILGVVLVLKRYSYIGNSLSNVAFGSMSVATVVGLTNKMYLILNNFNGDSSIKLGKENEPYIRRGNCNDCSIRSCSRLSCHERV